MMILLLDTNVILDALLARHPFAAEGAALFADAELGKYGGLVCATTITTTHYLARKVVGTPRATELIDYLLSIFTAAPVTEAVLKSALQLDFTDFEDAVLHASAHTSGAQGIVTRNARDFQKASLPIYEPAQAITLIRAS